MNASDIFDEALSKLFAAKKGKFLFEVEGIFSEETEKSLVKKAEIIHQRMNEGRKFSEICDDPDIFLGSLDKEYVCYRLDLRGFLDSPISLDRWRSNYLFLKAMKEIQPQ